MKVHIPWFFLFLVPFAILQTDVQRGPRGRTWLGLFFHIFPFTKPGFCSYPVAI